MKILYIENEYESAEETELMYNSFTDAEVDVVNPSDLDIDEMKDVYDAVLTDLSPGKGLMGPDILDRFNADTKAIYTAWRKDEARDHPLVSRALEEYQVIPRPSGLDLQELVEETL